MQLRLGSNASTFAPNRRGRTVMRLRLGMIAWAFAVPALMLALLFKFIPLGNSFVYSFQKVQPFLGNEFVGLSNYIGVLNDPKFQSAAEHTVVIAVFQTLGAVVFGLLLALLLEGQARRLWFVRTAVFLPVVAAVAVVAEAWRALLYPGELGFVNMILGNVGIPPQPFLSSPDTAIWTIIGIGIWSAAPYNMVIFIAGLAAIDRDMYEAAAIDGASLGRRLWSIVIPALRPAFAIVLTLAAIRALRVFTEVYVLTGGGPAGSTDVWMTRMFTVGTDGDVGRSSSAAIIMLVVTVLLTAGVQYLIRRRSHA
jgi:multiple sugar transport system permease protein